MTVLELLQLCRKHLAFVIVVPVICAIAMAAFSFVFMANTYTASTSLYALTSSSTNQTVSSSEMTASQQVANDISKLIESDRIKKDASAAANISTDVYSAYKVKVESSTTSRVLTVSVTGKNPQTAADIANGIATSVDSAARQLLKVEAIEVVDSAEVPTKASGPKRLLYAGAAFAVGLFFALVFIALRDRLNTTIRTPEEAEQLLGFPIIGRIPTLE